MAGYHHHLCHHHDYHSFKADKYIVGQIIFVLSVIRIILIIVMMTMIRIIRIMRMVMIKMLPTRSEVEGMVEQVGEGGWMNGPVNSFR